jgi:hypothetical protein
MEWLEKTMRSNYMRVLQPSSETTDAERFESLREPVRITKAIGSEIGSAVSESFNEYSDAAQKATDEGKLLEFAADSATAAGKGIVQGVGGIIGDAERLVNGFVALAKTPEGQDKITAFGKALQDKTFFTNSEDMAKHLENIFGLKEKEAMGFVEGAGELFAPIGTVAKAVKQTAKAVKSLDSNSNVINVLKTNIKDRVTGEKSTYNTYITNKTISNEQGVPLTLYHGTNKKFDNFDIDKSNTNVIYFTNDKSVAKQYSGKSGEIKSANVKMNKPLILSNAYFTSGIGEDIKLIFNKIKNKLNDSSDRTSPSHIWNPDSETINKLKSKGYDGIIVPAEINSRKEEYYMVFDPSQIEIIKN